MILEFTCDRCETYLDMDVDPDCDFDHITDCPFCGATSAVLSWRFPDRHQSLFAYLSECELNPPIAMDIIFGPLPVDDDNG